ncbi:MAG TPA: adenosylmethionine--8-amino-7-oxononanoate transaminase [Candidatus Angelobacter sp.]|nr:adenosylmethionine--8-amino-7-oxononanoate transaminase [Candidatus Angelobacter sp.]
MRRTLGVVGTDTEAGKTVVTAALVAALRARGMRVAGLKPVATGVEPGDPGEDATLLARASGTQAGGALLASFLLPRSPLAAARAEGRTLNVDELLRTIKERAAALDLLLVEGVGGLLVPLTERVTVRDLMRRLGAPVLVAGRAGLGTIGHCALTVEAARSAGLDVCGVVLSDVDGATDAEFARENAAQIEAQCDVQVLGILPFMADTSDLEAMATAAEAALDLDGLLAALRRDETLHEDVVALDRKHVWHPFTQTSEWRDEDPVVIRSAHGCRLVDARGREYIDGVASLWANVHGHGHPRLDAALREQAGRVAHSTFLGLTHEPGARLAAELCAVAPAGMTRVFYSEAGAAAVEVGLRIALLAQRHRGNRQRTRFVSLTDAYHGDTAGAVSVGRSEPFHRGLDPLLFDVLRVPPPHLFERSGATAHIATEQSLQALDTTLQEHGDEIAAVVIEPRIQGAAGMWPHSDEWLRRAVQAAHQAGALVLCDEVATGFGRTGDMFASAGAGVRPDILTVGKGITGGYLPLSATLVGEELFDLFTSPYTEHRALYYGHTYTANPLAAAVARASLQLFEEEDTLAGARRLATRLATLLAPLRALHGVADIRQRGVMAGIELCAGGLDAPHDPALRAGRRVVLAARRRGVIVRPLGDVVVLNPPLVLTDGDAALLVEAVAEAIGDVSAALPQAQGASA